MQLKINELELAAATPTSTSRHTEFGVSKQIHFVFPFQEAEVDKYFLHFESITSSIEWPKEMWTLLLQSMLLGKAWEVYSALSVDHSSDYDIVKSEPSNQNQNLNLFSEPRNWYQGHTAKNSRPAKSVNLKHM